MTFPPRSLRRQGRCATGQTAWGASTMPRLYVCLEIPLDKDQISFYVFKWSIYLRMCRHFLAAIYRYML